MALLFVGVLWAILIGVHMIVVGMARTAVQAAADRAVIAAQAAGGGPCGGVPGAPQSARECAGAFTAEWAMAASSGAAVMARPATVVVEPKRGSVTVWVHGATRSPLFGRIDVEARACGPLDDVLASDLNTIGDDLWKC